LIVHVHDAVLLKDFLDLIVEVNCDILGQVKGPANGVAADLTGSFELGKDLPDCLRNLFEILGIKQSFEGDVLK
jgi:hypothetical protein